MHDPMRQVVGKRSVVGLQAGIKTPAEVTGLGVQAIGVSIIGTKV